MNPKITPDKDCKDTDVLRSNLNITGGKDEGKDEIDELRRELVLYQEEIKRKEREIEELTRSIDELKERTPERQEIEETETEEDE